MRLVCLGLLALLFLVAPIQHVGAQEADILVRGDTARMEIERILQADNVDPTRLSAREVADLIAGIPRGRAPDDFWTAYRAHVAAWAGLADAEAAARARHVPSPEDEAALAMAQDAIEASFDEVVRIARRYGARMPTPPWQILSTA